MDEAVKNETRKLESVIGRQWAAAPSRTALTRTEKAGRYEVVPMAQPDQERRLVEMSDRGDSFDLRLREDLPPSVAKYFKEAPYEAEYHMRHNRQWDASMPTKAKTFPAGKVLNVAFDDAVWLLRDDKHGIYLEEVPSIETTGSADKAARSSDPVGDAQRVEAQRAAKAKAKK